jgi:hypothetical protein
MQSNRALVWLSGESHTHLAPWSMQSASLSVGRRCLRSPACKAWSASGARAYLSHPLLCLLLLRAATGYCPCVEMTMHATLCYEAIASKSGLARRAPCRTSPSDSPTIFDKIVAKEIPAQIIYEDDQCLAFRDIAPQAPVHFLVIPKNKTNLTRLSNATEGNKALLGHLMFIAQHVAKQGSLLTLFYASASACAFLTSALHAAHMPASNCAVAPSPVLKASCIRESWRCACCMLMRVASGFSLCKAVNVPCRGFDQRQP